MLPAGLHVAQPSAKEERGREIVRRKEEMEEEKVKLRIKSPMYTVSHPSSASMTPVTPSSPIYNKPKNVRESNNEMTVPAAPPSVSSSTSTSLSNGEPEATVLVTNGIKNWKMRSSSCSSLAVSPSFKSKISRFRFRRTDQTKQIPPKNVQDDC